MPFFCISYRFALKSGRSPKLLNVEIIGTLPMASHEECIVQIFKVRDH